MAFQDLPIKRKVTGVIMLTSFIVLVLTVAAFMISDLITYRETLRHDLITSAGITANASSAALAFQDENDAAQVLSGLKADPTIVAAAFYDLNGHLFVRYPTNIPVSEFPARPGPIGTEIGKNYIEIFDRVAQAGKSSGILYVRSSLEPLYERLRMYALLAFLVLC